VYDGDTSYWFAVNLGMDLEGSAASVVDAIGGTIQELQPWLAKLVSDLFIISMQSLSKYCLIPAGTMEMLAYAATST
jgi:hypothetical protein